MIIDIIKRTIREYNLLKDNDKVLIGLSGGADSVFLTHVLWSLKDEFGIQLYTAHINHGIRGAEAKRDEDFVKAFSKKFNIECFVKCVDVPVIAKQLGESEEMAGRKVRYDFFDELCKSHHIDKIATAHNKNDNAETILMNIIRGSSIKGLCGIPYKRGNIVRPILNISREDIEEYCRTNNLEYVIDSTNLSNDYTRNKIRHIVLPLITKEFNANFINTITENASLMRNDSDFLDSEVLKFYNDKVKNNEVLISDLTAVPMSIRQRTVRHMLQDVYGGLNDISSGYVSDVMNLIKKTTGTQINFQGRIIAKNEYGKLIIEHEKVSFKPFKYEISVGEIKQFVDINKSVKISAVDKRENDGSIYLSSDSFDEIVIRSKLSGDKFLPIGMSGTKKVKDYFIDNKIPKNKRNEVPIIEINGEIAAVGNRVDRRFAFHNSGIKIEIKDI